MSLELTPLHTWLIEPLEPAVAHAIDRLRRAPDVRHVAVMPDVHLATEVCVGTVFGTSHLIYPQAVGGDIGCGMLAIAFDASADLLRDPHRAGSILRSLGESIPTSRHHRAACIEQPEDLKAEKLSHGQLEAFRRGEGILQFGTLGGGNHFVELQADDDNRLWLMIHSGSRAIGQAIRSHHLAQAQRVGSGLFALDASAESGQAYLHDVGWARRYAAGNRHAMMHHVCDILGAYCDTTPDFTSIIHIDHNHVARELHAGQDLWVHRKGAMPAGNGAAGVLPDSMGTSSYHVVGRGNPDSLHSSAHGAGRAMSRETARKTITRSALHHQMAEVWYDYRIENALREESPAAYKNIGAVLRAQRDLTRITRTLRPVLNFKGKSASDGSSFQMRRSMTR